MSTQEETKQDKIRQLLEMQRRFIARDRERGVDMQEYFTPEEDSPLHNYRQEYMQRAMEVVELAHEEKGSKR